MMFERYGFFDYFVIFFTIWVAFFSLAFILIQADTINIEYNYKEELKQCELDLKNTQPICPDIEVKPSGWFFPLFVGIMIGFILDGLWIKYQREKIKSKQKRK